jgi:serine/threonine protein kinase
MAKRRASSFHEFEATWGAILKGPQIGQGAFSKIYLGRYFGDVVAIKEQLREKEEMDEYLKREISILKQASHPNILNFCGSIERVEEDGQYCLYILTEYAQAGDFLQLILSNNSLGWRFRCQLLHEAAMGMEYLHNRNLIHRDIKGENFLLTKEWKVKVSDLGMARPLVESSSTTMTICGTEEYMAPELMFDEAYHNPVDVYALGMVMFEAMKRQKVGTDEFMSRSPADNFAFDEAAAREALPDDAPPSLVELAIQSLSYNDYDRPCSEDVVGWLEDLIGELPEDTEPLPTAKEMPVIPSPPSPPPFATAAAFAQPVSTEPAPVLKRSQSAGDVAKNTTPLNNVQERASELRQIPAVAEEGAVADDQDPPSDEDDTFDATNSLPDGLHRDRSTEASSLHMRPTLRKARSATISGLMSGLRDTFSPNRGRQTIMLKSPNSPSSLAEEFSGELHKRGMGFNILAWRKRYFVLRRGTLYWFGSKVDFEKTNEAMGKVDLTPETTIKPMGNSKFLISNPDCVDARENQREFAATDAEQYTLWVAHLEHSIEALRLPADGSSPKRSSGERPISMRRDFTASEERHLQPTTFSFENIEDWLSSLGLKDELLEKFSNAGYTSMAAINETGLSDEDFEHIGVDRPQARRTLAMASKGGFSPHLRLSVRSHREMGDVVVYEVVGQYRFYRSSQFLSYADFVKLHQKLRTHAYRTSMRRKAGTQQSSAASPDLPNLPSDHMSILQNMRSEAFLLRRKSELDAYILRISELAQEEESKNQSSERIWTFDYLLGFFRLGNHNHLPFPQR